MSKHLKAYAAPKSWTILRKVNKWTLRPKSGAHPLDRSLPIGTLLKQTKHAKTTKEAKYIVNQKAVSVDGKLVRDIHASCGFMDVIAVKDNAPIRCTIDKKGRLSFVNSPKGEENKKICRVTGKRTIKEGKIQYSLLGGRSIISKEKYNVGDSLIIEVPSQKILAHYPMEKGHTAFLLGGSHIGNFVTIDKIEGEKIFCTKDKEKIETAKKIALIVGKNKPELQL
jgi:small subunit ribosomal protein S4e